MCSTHVLLPCGRPYYQTLLRQYFSAPKSQYERIGILLSEPSLSTSNDLLHCWPNESHFHHQFLEFTPPRSGPPLLWNIFMSSAAQMNPISTTISRVHSFQIWTTTTFEHFYELCSPNEAHHPPPFPEFTPPRSGPPLLLNNFMSSYYTIKYRQIFLGREVL
jgi:hypothetical protein